MVCAVMGYQIREKKNTTVSAMGLFLFCSVNLSAVFTVLLYCVTASGQHLPGGKQNTAIQIKSQPNQPPEPKHRGQIELRL